MADVDTTDVPNVVFIGSPTIDHLIHSGRAHQAIGGAAFISALAARWAGTSVGIVARVPHLLPHPIASVFGVGGLHRNGLKICTGHLPEFRISYDAEERATYDQMKVGMEADLCAEDIPTDWLNSRWIHVAGIGVSSAQQLRVVNGIRKRAPGWGGMLSAGTCRAMIEADPSGTLSLLHQCDVFFLNQEEFGILLPDGVPKDHQGTILVTDGKHGVRVFGGPHQGHYPVQSISPLDPTGAGDSFCGGFIGAVLEEHPKPVEQGIQIARNVLEGMGANTLIHAVASKVQKHADHTPSQIQNLAATIREHGQAAAFDFAQAPHLPVGHPLALPMLFISTLHQYGFWTATVEDGWVGPMYAELDGVKYKGSDFIWAAFARAARCTPELLSIERMATDPTVFKIICTADNGECPVPDLMSHQQLHQAHAQVMKRQWPGGYTEILRRANRSPQPVRTLLKSIGFLPGYMADPLAKKANLLAIILGARPEGFLEMKDLENIDPIVDYHMMRVCLRTGLVTINNPDLISRINARMWVDPTEELAIRQATGRAILGLAQETQCSIAAIDGLFFKVGRTYCVETETPRCDSCPLHSDCGHHTLRFQPVFRTTAY